MTLHNGAQVHTTKGAAREPAELKMNEILRVVNLRWRGLGGHERDFSNDVPDLHPDQDGLLPFIHGTQQM